MPSTHMSLHYHIVFCTKGRRRIASGAVAGGTACYIGGITRDLGALSRSIGGEETGNNSSHHSRGARENLNDDQGLRSFYSLNPWLFSVTPPRGVPSGPTYPALYSQPE